MIDDSALFVFMEFHINIKEYATIGNWSIFFADNLIKHPLAGKSKINNNGVNDACIPFVIVLPRHSH